MATITALGHSRLLELVTAPFRAIGSFLLLLAETGPRIRAVERLNRMSDEELAARGTTRAAEVQRIFAVRTAI